MPPMLQQRRWTRPAGRPINQLDRMDGRKLRARSDLSHAADIACCNNIRSQSLDSPDFALAQPPCDIRLQNIVCSCRATTQVAIRHVLYREAEFEQQILWLPRYPLAMLERARRMIGHDEWRRAVVCCEWQHGQIFADVLGESGHLRRRSSVRRIGPQHEAVVLHRRAATRRG